MNDNINESLDEEWSAEGIMLYNDEDPLWRKEIMIAQIMIYANDGISEETLNIIYGQEYVAQAMSILKPRQKTKSFTR